MIRHSFPGLCALGLLCVALAFVGSGATTPTGRESAATESDRYGEVAQLLSREAWSTMTPRQQDLLCGLVAKIQSGTAEASYCFHPGTDTEVVQAFQLAQAAIPEYQITGRWQSTATNPGGASQGDPTTLTYSFAPDGTIIPGLSEPQGPSNLFASFNGAFGSQATWQNLIHQVFQRWGQLTGITYVHETNDDGVTMGSQAGVIGVRGDLRIAGHFIDGSGGILAYNNFPQNGDMVLDTGDASFYSNSSSNYLRFRNTIAHEHGHGMGLLHVCPSVGTKLMEPFISTAYDGPQVDDRLGSQRQYGDANEHNDSANTATALGGISGSQVVQDVSIDDNGDVDYFRFGVAANVEIDVTVTPVGGTYTQGPQTSACNGGSSFNASALSDLEVELLDVDGTTVLATASAQPAGVAESITNIFVPGNADYYVRVRGTANDVQAYTLQLVVTPGTPPAFSINYPGGIPATIPPGQTTAVTVHTTDLAGTADPNGGTLFTSINGGAWASSSMTFLGSGDFEALLPSANCFDTLRWYVVIAPLGGGSSVVSPLGAPGSNTHFADVVSGTLVTVLQDDFELPSAWVVTNDAALTDGPWGRGIPVGGGDRGDPPTAFGGSGYCFLTDNVDGNSDVDGGSTTLTSPSFDLSTFSDARISAQIWYDNAAGSNPGTDVFRVDISNNGGTSWVNLLTHNQSPDVWLPFSWRVSDFVTPSANMLVRFVASDPAPGAVVEAGVDAFKVEACQPTAPPPSLGSCAVGSFPASNLFVNFSDGGTDHRVDVPVGTSLAISQVNPAGMASANWFLFAKLGVPAASDAVTVTGVGTFCFNPCVLVPGGDPTGWLLADSLSSTLCGGALLSGTTAPWTHIMPAPTVPFEVTLQSAVEETPGVFKTSNAVLIRFN